MTFIDSIYNISSIFHSRSKVLAKSTIFNYKTKYIKSKSKHRTTAIYFSKTENTVSASALFLSAKIKTPSMINLNINRQLNQTIQVLSIPERPLKL